MTAVLNEYVVGPPLWQQLYVFRCPANAFIGNLAFRAAWSIAECEAHSLLTQFLLGNRLVLRGIKDSSQVGIDGYGAQELLTIGHNYLSPSWGPIIRFLFAYYITSSHTRRDNNLRSGQPQAGEK